jgi:hypothetical protein
MRQPWQTANDRNRREDAHGKTRNDRESFTIGRWQRWFLVVGVVLIRQSTLKAAS